MFTDIHIKWVHNNIGTWGNFNFEFVSIPLDTEYMATAQKVAAWLSFSSLAEGEKETASFFSPLLPLASLTPSYSVGSLQGQWTVQKTGGRLAEMHTLWQSVFTFFYETYCEWKSSSLARLVFYLSYGQLMQVPASPSLHPQSKWAASKHHGQKQDFLPWAAAKSY